MPKLINRYGVVDKAGTDGWIEYTGDASAIPVGAKVLLPLTEFREFAGTWQKHVGDNGALGVCRQTGVVVCSPSGGTTCSGYVGGTNTRDDLSFSKVGFAALRVGYCIAPAPLARALNELVRRHEALRTVFEAVDGKPVQSMIDLAAKVRTRQPGDTVELTVSNGGDQRVVKVTLERAPSN